MTENQPTGEGTGTRKTDKPASLQGLQHGGDHYKNMVIEPAYYNHVNMIPFCAAEAIKYLSRYRFKNGSVDVQKALHFCQMILDFDYGVHTKVEYNEDSAVDLSGADRLLLSWKHLAVPFDTTINLTNLQDIKTIHKTPVDEVLYREVSEIIITSFYNCAPAVLSALLNQVFGLEGEHSLEPKDVMAKERRRALTFYSLAETKSDDEDLFVPRSHIDLVCGGKHARFKTRWNITDDTLDLSGGAATAELWSLQYHNLLLQAPEVIADLLNQKLGTDYSPPPFPCVTERPLHPAAAAMQRAAEPDPPATPPRYRRNLCNRPPLKMDTEIKPETLEEMGAAIKTAPGLRRYSGFAWITNWQRVVPGSVMITVPCQTDDPDMVIRDDGEGLLTGDVSEQTGLTPSIINYETGGIELSLSKVPLPDTLFDIRFDTEKKEDDRATSIA